jgi:hypothetical protein
MNKTTWKVTRLSDTSCKVENLKTGFCDFPIRYKNGLIVYDYPELIPAYVKEMVSKEFKP